MSDEFITTEDYLNANRSPQLQPTQPNFLSIETPPPLDDSDDNYDSDVTEARGEGGHVCRVRSSKGRPQPSVCDSLLMRLLGPNYPEVALTAGTELFTLSPEKACEDCRPSTAALKPRMLGNSLQRASSGTAEERLARAALDASHKFNVAINDNGRVAHTAHILQSGFDKLHTTVHVREIGPETVDVLSNRYQKSLGINNTMVNRLSASGLSPPKSLNVKPPPKVSLPAIRTGSSGLQAEQNANAKDSIATSPALAQFAITPAYGNPQQLPKMQSGPPQSLPGLSPGRNQTLPSLETALKQIPDTDGAPYSAHSATISRPSPLSYAQYGPSSVVFSNHSPASAISPPRLPTHPAYWRTTSHETSSSTPSDQTSAVPSAGISTPASSYCARSPSNSVSTPATVVPDIDNMSAVSASSSQLTDGHSQYNGAYGNGSFKCTFPSCNAPPFQTQYLLNSHANVHSNTRNHFCPVQGCPRGPGGQGFKRKNEMIRHGLVHQSPGYVCPFCPDQQHKYPRPDNLQRHVRVHHVDKDRDHPLLREVLAQRPEGGNRGRRRRLGS